MITSLSVAHCRTRKAAAARTRHARYRRKLGATLGNVDVRGIELSSQASPLTKALAKNPEIKTKRQSVQRSHPLGLSL
jgi:hypothetical protein